MYHEMVGEGQLENPASCSDQAAAVVCQQDHGGSSSIGNIQEHATGRSAVDDWRTAVHEASHCVVGRALGQDVAGCTIIPGDNFAGLTWGPTFDGSMLNFDNEVPNLCQAIGELMPGAGEARADAAEIYAHVHVGVVDLMAGTVGELVLHPACTPWVAQSDIRQARALAGLICSSEESITAYMEFGRAEAKALILQHQAAVLAIAEALMVQRTLDATMIDDIISRAPERARRADWIAVLENASTFTAELEN